VAQRQLAFAKGRGRIAQRLGNVVGLVLVLTTVPVFAAILRVPFAAIAPMIVASADTRDSATRANAARRS